MKFITLILRIISQNNKYIKRTPNYQLQYLQLFRVIAMLLTKFINCLVLKSF